MGQINYSAVNVVEKSQSQSKSMMGSTSDTKPRDRLGAYAKWSVFVSSGM